MWLEVAGRQVHALWEKLFNIIDFPLSTAHMQRFNKPEKVAEPPLASCHLLVQVREHMRELTLAHIKIFKNYFKLFLKSFH